MLSLFKTLIKGATIIAYSAALIFNKLLALKKTSKAINKQKLYKRKYI